VATDSIDLATRLDRCDHVDFGGLELPQAQQESGGTVGNHRSGPTSEHRREELPPLADPPMPHRKSLTEYTVQPAAGDRAGDRTLRHAQIPQLLS
jgi:hypothetical protein